MTLQVTLRGCGFYRRKGGEGSETRELLTPNRAFLDVIPGAFEYGWAGDEAGAGGVYEQVFISMQGEIARQIARHIHRVHGPVLDFGSDLSVAETMLAFVDAIHPPRRAEPSPIDRTLRATGKGKWRAGEERLALASRRRVEGSGAVGVESRVNRYVASGQLYGLLMHVLSVLTRSREMSAPLVARAIELIETHASDPAYNVARLAGTLDCSREHLAREFRRATGATPLEYLTRRRVRLAGAELRAARDKLEVIAPMCGFTSAAYLCRVFRKMAGVTPQQYRERPWMVLP